MSSLVCGIHHVGINVPDLEAGRRFYSDVFGFEAIGVDNWEEGNAEINSHVGLDESSAQSYMLRGSNTYLELWHYTSPPSRRQSGETCAADYGYTHLCFAVRDFDRILEKFLAAGGALIKPLTNVKVAGAKMHYCQDPFGNIIELIELPEGGGTAIKDLPSIGEEGAYAAPADKYYVIENGRFAGMRDSSEL